MEEKQKLKTVAKCFSELKKFWLNKGEIIETPMSGEIGQVNSDE